MVVEKDGKRFPVPFAKLNAESVELAKKLSLQEAPEGFALIPGGEFTMGDTLGECEFATPHQINVSAFYMQKNLVSKAQWDEVREWGVKHDYTDLPEGKGKATDHPVQTVSWYDVVKWCNAKSEKEGLIPCYYSDAAQTTIYRTGSANLANTMVKWSANGYRLPTEAEWEKAARGGLSGKRFPWGDTITHGKANYGSTRNFIYDVSQTRNSHPVYSKGGEPFTSPVGSFAPNGYGLYDMAGNVTEWCWDGYSSSYYTSSPANDPRGAAAGPRIRRGGGWMTYASFCRVADRSYIAPSHSVNYTGFRAVRSAVP